MTFNKGSLILLDYTAKIKDTGEVFETTIEEKPKNILYMIITRNTNQDLFRLEKDG